MLARHLDRKDAAPQEDRADRVATYEAWVEDTCLLHLIIAWRLVLGEEYGLRVAGAGLRVVVAASCGLTKAYAMTISATDMWKRATSTMTNWCVTLGGGRSRT